MLHAEALESARTVGLWLTSVTPSVAHTWPGSVQRCGTTSLGGASQTRALSSDGWRVRSALCPGGQSADLRPQTDEGGDGGESDESWRKLGAVRAARAGAGEER